MGPTQLLLLTTLLAVAAGTDWTSKRHELIDVLFGSTGLPTRSSPDHVEAIPFPQAKGCYCAYYGGCSAKDCRYGNNMTKIVWTMENKVTVSSHY